MTMPNRAFACAGTSQGHMDDRAKRFTVPSIFGALTRTGVPWKIYGDTAPPLTKLDFDDTRSLGIPSPLRPAHRLPRRRRVRPPARLRLVRTELVLHGQQRAPQLRHRARGATPTRHLSGVRDGPGHHTADHHLRRARRLLRPRPPALERDTARLHSRPVRFRLHPIRPRVPTVLISPLIPAGTVFRSPGVPLGPHQHPPPPVTPPTLAAQQSHLDQVRQDLLAEPNNH